MVRRVERRDSLGLPPKHEELRRIAHYIINSRGTTKVEHIGGHWTARFIARHPEIATMVAHAMDRERALSCNKKNIESYFKRLYDVIHRYHIDPVDVWNFDEKGFLMGQGNKKNELVIARVKSKKAHHIQDSSREWVTLVEAASATGGRLPAFYIYKGAAHYDGWHRGDIDPLTSFTYTWNGWTNDQATLHWLKNHFNVHAPPSRPNAHRHLLCDNHSSHDNFEFIEFCLDQNIHLFFLPSHTTRILQPLDVGIFSPFDRACNKERSNWDAKQPLHTPLHKGDFIPLCERARKQGLRVEVVCAAWKKTGLHPWNP